MALKLVLVLSSYLFLTRGLAQGNLDDFDCVDIYKQPAFQHPLLKDHKIQQKFSNFDDEKYEESYKNATKYEIYYSLPEQSCPEGTVAILKLKNGTQKFHTDSFEYPGQHFATIETTDGTIYRGVEAGFSVHAVAGVKENQYSKSQLWVENGPRSDLNSIQVGWAVHPRLYGDSNTRFTIYWTGNGYKGGCYNTKCPGFVIVTRYPVIGSVLRTSTNNYAYIVEPEIFQDGFSGNWALKIAGKVIGYWPKKLFTHLNNGASLIRLGGNTFASPDGYSPPMGNGHYPVFDYAKSSYYRRVHLKDSQYRSINLVDTKQKINEDNPCYKVSNWRYLKFLGINFGYGGQGGHCGI